LPTSAFATGKNQAVKAEIFTIAGSGPGKLSTMARPRGGDWLVDEMDALRATGVSLLVSMLTPSEERDLGLAEEAAEAEAAGLEFIALPTPDFGLPQVAAFRGVVNRLVRALEHGSHVVVHCRMGIGRSSMLAAAVLMAGGLTEQDAWAAVRKARGLEVPDTPRQRRWVQAVMLQDGSK
jgi:protein-tyrosine phosphatase